MYLKANSPHAAAAGKSIIGFNLINGREVEGDLSLIQAKSAADHRDLVGMFPDSGEKDVARAAKAAADAFPPWSHSQPAYRQALVRRAAAVLAEHRNAFARIVTREIGLTGREAQVEVQEALDACAFFTGDGLMDEGHTPGSFTRRRPAGVVGLLATGCSPLAAPARKLIPALLAGNTVVWKPSDNAPTAAYLLLRALLEAGLPAGVVNTVNGRGRAGCGKHFLAGIEKGHFQAFAFVGSPVLARTVGELCGRSLILPSFELARKGAMVVLPDADLDLAAADAEQAAFAQAGQGLRGLANILVHEACSQAFRQRFLDRVAGLKVGNPVTDPAVDCGPMINARAATAFKEHWDTGRAEGATLLTGGEAWSEANRTDRVLGNIAHGAYLQPCVWDGVRPDMGLFRQPALGPTVNLCAFGSLDEALGWLQEASCGSSVGLYTRNQDEADRFLQHSRAQSATLNTLVEDPEARLRFAGQGARSGLQPLVDGFTRWQAASRDLPLEAPGADPQPGPALATDWASL